MVIVSLFVFSPLLRYWISDTPTMFGYRAFSRLSVSKRRCPDPHGRYSSRTCINGLLMFNWDNGEIWVIRCSHRPALDL
jgi:hypothetical protein